MEAMDTDMEYCDSEEELQQQVEKILDKVDERMELSEDEKARAIGLKNAIASHPDEEMKPIPDMEIAHIAIVRHQSLEIAVDTAYKMQAFREELKIRDSVEDGVSTIREFMRLQPGFLMDLSYLPSEGTYTWSCDYACLNPAAVKSNADWRAFQGGFYYMMRATATDFRSIRTGLMTLSECDGMGRHNFDISLFEKAVYELWSFYPANYKETVWVNTPSAANMCYSLLRRIVSKDLANSWRIGEQIDGHDGRLNELFHMPNQQAAEEALLVRIAGYLSERYDRERSYVLVP